MTTVVSTDRRDPDARPKDQYPGAASVVQMIRHAMPGAQDLTLRQLSVLVALDRTMSIRDLSPLLDLQKPIVTRCVGRLLDLGLVAKRRNVGDERLVDIDRTDAGISLVAKLDRMASNLALTMRDRRL